MTKQEMEADMERRRKKRMAALSSVMQNMQGMMSSVMKAMMDDEADTGEAPDEPADVQHSSGGEPSTSQVTSQPPYEPNPAMFNGILYLNGTDLYLIDDTDEGVMLMKAIMEPGSVEAGLVRKAIDKRVGGGVDRAKLKDSDFVFSDTRSFPIVTAGDVKDAVSSWGRYKGKHSFDEFKSRLTALAKRKGFESSLPKEWKDAKKAIPEELLQVGVKSLYDANKSDQVWVGVSHNAWQDDAADIIPLALIEADISRQKKAIADGRATQYGKGLWIDHNAKAIAGDCTLREVVEGGRFCFEMGSLVPGHDDLNDRSMSIGYNYGKNKKGEYVYVNVYERSGLKATRRVNGRTFISVKRRNLLQDAAMGSVAEELSARLEE